MGRKSNDVETRKRKTKKDKARRKKELFGKYRPTREGDVISQKPKNQKKNFSKSSQNQKKSKKNFSKSSQKSKTKSKK